MRQDNRAGAKAGLKPRARIRAFANIGSEPAIMLTGPVDVTKKVLAELNMGSSVYSSPVPANGTLYISNRNQLYALSEAAAAKPATAKN